MKALFPKDPYPGWLDSIENEVLKTYTEVPPEVRDWNEIGKRFDLNHEQLLDLQSFYGLNFFNFPGMIGNKQELLAHVGKKSRDVFIKNGRSPTAKRFRYYQSNTGKLSVSEMAQTLRISEGEVYRDLSILGISLKITHSQGLNVPASQAERMAKHHAGEEPRAVTWNRIFQFRGSPMLEEQILIELFYENYPYQDIATELNHLAGTTQKNHPDIRTQASVSARI